ncbi:hypothetical protein BDR05DRAFT_947601 [Suillus weaverae]|nr:hypothetical protein BDR05DRAFT_947601 [Suillus weaverae]
MGTQFIPSLLRVKAAPFLLCMQVQSQLAEAGSVVLPYHDPLIYHKGWQDDGLETCWTSSGFKINVQHLSNLTLNLGPLHVQYCCVPVNYGKITGFDATQEVDVIPFGHIFSASDAVVRVNSRIGDSLSAGIDSYGNIHGTISQSFHVWPFPLSPLSCSYDLAVISKTEDRPDLLKLMLRKSHGREQTPCTTTYPPGTSSETTPLPPVSQELGDKTAYLVNATRWIDLSDV